MTLCFKNGIATMPESPSLTFPYEPDNFQIHSFNAIEDGKHVLVTAHTGSGKTSIAEYAIAYGIKNQQKIIYTSPIKALSMQIYGDFKKKYPHWSVGIKTGDVNENVEEAQVLIVTTEILRNSLFIDDSGLDMKRVKVVIFDEVHWIKDPDRGTVWEESIIRMPDNIQMVMLSATLPDAMEFAQWIVNCKKTDVVYTTTERRIIPLSHYVLTDTEKLLIMDNEKNFHKDNYLVARNDYSFNIKKLDSYIGRIELPGLFFCFSRKKCELYAKSIKKSFIDAKQGKQLVNLFDDMIRKFNDYYQNMDETKILRRLLFKGIGYHHAGLPPPLKEIIQELFGQGFIKILFVTETFAAGVNMPAKTTVFCGLSKYSSETTFFRSLLPEEYGQISGRAGRRGLDDKGTVILLPFEGLPTLPEAIEMMKGKIGNIVSRFRIDYSYVLKCLVSGQPINIIEKSLLASQENKINLVRIDKLKQLQHELAKIEKIPESEITKCQLHIKFIDNKLKKSEKKHYNKKIKPWAMSNKPIITRYKKIMSVKSEIKDYQYDIDCQKKKYDAWLSTILYLLMEYNYIEGDIPNKYGQAASCINECNPIMLTELLSGVYLDNIDSFEQLISILAVFLPSKFDDRELIWIDPNVKDIIISFGDDIKEFETFEAQKQLWYSNWDINLEYTDISYLWVKGIDYNSIIERTGSQIYSGEFVRMMLKLSNICKEAFKILKLFNNNRLLKLLDGYQDKIVRDIVFPQSLYLM
jgi:superfamily II RNA helicase